MGKRKGAPQKLNATEAAEQTWSLKDVDVNMETDSTNNQNVNANVESGTLSMHFFY